MSSSLDRLPQDAVKLLIALKLSIHNTKFPVLVGTEQVVACRYTEGRISTESGSIDTRRIQNDTINIMDGGEVAFNRHKGL